MIARATVSPPTPLSKTPRGASVTILKRSPPPGPPLGRLSVPSGHPCIRPRLVAMSTALLTDRYELTMIDASLESGRHARRSVFEVFARSLPGARRFGVVAGTGRLLELITQFRFR